MAGMNKRQPETLDIKLPSGLRVTAAIRRFSTSKNLRMHLEDNGSVFLTAPPGASLKSLQGFAQSLAPKLERLLAENTRLHPPVLPESIYLPPFNLKFHVKYSTPESGKELSENCCEIHLQNNLLSIACHKTQDLTVLCGLQSFFLRQAKILLPEYINGVAPKNSKFLFTVRDQKKRMGSCSIRKDAYGNILETPVIHLNWRCIFLPEELLRHVCMHEITHIDHANHSRDFYRHLETLSPDCKATEKTLAMTWKNLPGWVLYHS